MTKVAQDVRVALRGFQRTPGFAVAVLAILGLGIGMAVAMFTTFETILIRPLPVRGQDRLAVMWPFRVKDTELSPASADLRDVMRTSRTTNGVAGIAHWGVSSAPFLDGDRTIRLEQSLATANYFDVIGARAAVGRLFISDDDASGAPGVMVLSYHTWMTQFDGSPSVIGRHVLDPWSRESYSIVGVAPPGLDYPVGVDCWTSLTRKDSTVRVLAVARLAPGSTLNAARDEYFSIINRLEPTWKLTGATAETFTTAVVGDVRPTLVALTAAVGLLLLIACVNIGNLFLIRAGARTRELSIRRAIGASYGDLIRQLTVESALLAAAGGLLGVVCAETLLRALIALAPPQLPRLDDVRLHGGLLGIATVTTAIAVLLFGVLPALIGARVNLASPLRHDARSGSETNARRRVRDWLVASQVALALVMLSGAGLLTRSLIGLEQLHLGYRAEHLSIMSVAYDPKTFAPTDTARSARVEANLAIDAQFESRMLSVPGVSAVTPIMTPPFLGAGINVGLFEAEGQSDAEVGANPTIPWEVAGTQYFHTFDMPMVRGRGFLESDREGAEPVAVVSESVVRRLWPGQDPIGKRLRFAPSAQKAGDPLPKMFSDWRTIVGVVSDTHFRNFRDSSPTVYVPWRQMPGIVWGNFAIRSTGDPGATAAAIRTALKELNPTYTLWNLRTLNDILAEPLAEPRLSALLLIAFGAVALLLAAVGLYGVMSSAVREGTREIGIRIALGATPALIRAAVVRRALRVTMIGGAVGLVVALMATRLLRTLLFGVSSFDPLTLSAVSIVLLGVSLVAAYIPARRATRIDPMEALRAD